MQNNTLSNYRVLFRMLKMKNMGTWQHLYVDNIKIMRYYIK